MLDGDSSSSWHYRPEQLVIDEPEPTWEQRFIDKIIWMDLDPRDYRQLRADAEATASPMLAELDAFVFLAVWVKWCARLRGDGPR